MVTIFYERDAKPDALKGKTIAILGYGSQGHAQAQNLRDSGHKVIIGLDPNRQSAQQARADGMVVVSPDEAAKRAAAAGMLTRFFQHYLNGTTGYFGLNPTTVIFTSQV